MPRMRRALSDCGGARELGAVASGSRRSNPQDPGVSLPPALASTEGAGGGLAPNATGSIPGFACCGLGCCLAHRINLSPVARPGTHTGAPGSVGGGGCDVRRRLCRVTDHTDHPFDAPCRRRLRVLSPLLLLPERSARAARMPRVWGRLRHAGGPQEMAGMVPITRREVRATKPPCYTSLRASVSPW